MSLYPLFCYCTHSDKHYLQWLWYCRLCLFGDTINQTVCVNQKFKHSETAMETTLPWNSWLPTLLPCLFSSHLYLGWIFFLNILPKEMKVQAVERTDSQIYSFSCSANHHWDRLPLEQMPLHQGFSHCIFQLHTHSTNLGMDPARSFNSSVGAQRGWSLGCAGHYFYMVFYCYYVVFYMAFYMVFIFIRYFLASLLYCLWNRAELVCVSRVIFLCLNSSHCLSGVELYLLFSQGYLLHTNKQNVITYLYVCNYCLQLLNPKPNSPPSINKWQLFQSWPEVCVLC